MLALTPQPARAHSGLTSSSPAADSTVTTAPTELTLTFAEVVRGSLSTVVVTGPDGARYQSGSLRAVDRTLTQPVKPLISGRYTVAWRIVSADGHPLQGVYTFTADLPSPSPSPVAPTTPSAADTPSAVDTPSPAAVSAAQEDEGGNGLLLAAAAAGLLVVIVGGVALVWRRRSA
ncbi:hypothetical protein SAMN05443668_1097 [Cryptosporangium aurantiacum]|uniref:CopC domain-containing protein n=1 Tax=Cryptosporangium aurantiacum TaxID=134849 RepID=A0A1M7RA66_9ACTN|nr:hypothetical protein SAMN05443668_1097 [Cryptosporangium aurantiacum]